MIPDDQLTFVQLGCRGVARLFARAAVVTVRQHVMTPAFLALYSLAYRRVIFAAMRRYGTPQGAHEGAVRVMGVLDTYCPLWALRLVHWLAFPPRDWGAIQARAKKRGAR